MGCASSSTVMCERLVKCASGPVIMCEGSWNVRVRVQ